MQNNALKVHIEYLKWRRISRGIDRLTALILLALIAPLVWMVLDEHAFQNGDFESIPYHNFDELLSINPDTVAWLTLEGAEVDHPVVQGKDNFVYLDKDFTGEFYAGGSLFLDAANARDFSDRYCIIHGHHMSNGTMFGRLEKYLNEAYLERHNTGSLLTPAYDYDLKVIAAGTYDAYDSRVYAPGGRLPKMLTKEAGQKTAGQVLALSTCGADMNDNRTVVFCEMTNRRPHE